MNSLLGVLEIALNRYLSLEPAAVAAAGQLQGHALVITLSDWDWSVCVYPDATGVQLSDVVPNNPDVHLTGTTRDFLCLLANRSDAAHANINSAGDARMAARFLQLPKRVEPELEELLEPLVGELLSVPVARLGRDLMDEGQNVASAALSMLSRDMQGEGQLLASGEEAACWMQGVKELSGATEQLRERVLRLRKTVMGASA